jgi:hypothetical protein
MTNKGKSRGERQSADQGKRQKAKGKNSHISLKCLALIFAFSLFPFAATAQDDPPETAPPPIKIVSKDERSRLDVKNDIKDRTKLAVEMMQVRIAAAQKMVEMRNFEGMYIELGHFHGLMDDTLEFLNKRDNGSGKVLDNFKRLELALRALAPKIEVMRRELPIKYDPYVRKLMGYLRQARAKATDSLFDDTVVPVRKPNIN